MTTTEFLKIAVYFALILAVSKPLGLYMRRVFSGERTFLNPVMRPLERLVYRVSGVDETKEHDWIEYTVATIVFSAVGLLLPSLIQRFQHILPLNPDRMPAVAPDLAWNTAVSFTTNTNWQAYSGESTMSHFTQMVGLTFHNFVSAATGIALAIALIRGIARAGAKTIGNFRVDLTRATLWILLPICLLAATLFLSQGVIQNFHASVQATTVEGKLQKIPQGPVASQEAIKELGTNGGGFFHANSAFPYENPTPFTNLLQMFLIFCIGAGLCYTLGSMTGKLRHGWAVFWAMSLLFLAGVFLATLAGQHGNSMHQRLG